MSDTTRIVEVQIDMLAEDGSYIGRLYNVNGADALSEVESCEGQSIPETLRCIADAIEAAAAREFDPRRPRPS
jgi:hypothetical protein